MVEESDGRARGGAAEVVQGDGTGVADNGVVEGDADGDPVAVDGDAEAEIVGGDGGGAGEIGEGERGLAGVEIEGVRATGVVGSGVIEGGADDDAGAMDGDGVTKLVGGGGARVVENEGRA